MKLRGAIFDLDGTLVDTLPVCFAAFRAALARLGERRHADEEIRALFGPSEDGVMQRAVPARWREALALFHEEYERHLPMCPALFPAVASAFSVLRERGIPLALVTGKGPVTTRLSLVHFGLEHVFDAVESGSPRGVVKADAIDRIVRRWSMSAAEVIYVGDAEVDMVAARQAGVGAVGAAWAPATALAELERGKPDLIFTRADDFLAWLLGRL